MEEETNLKEMVATVNELYPDVYQQALKYGYAWWEILADDFLDF